MLVKTYCAAVNGLEVTTVTIEVSITRGVLFHLTGLGDETVRESRDRIAAALMNNGYRFPVADITINMAPADIRKEGIGYDLPLAIGLLAGNGNMQNSMLQDYMLVGELGLDGTLQPIRGALPIAIRARAQHFKGLIVPRQNIREAAVVNNLQVYGMDNLTDVINFFNGTATFEPTVIDTRREFYEQSGECEARPGGGGCRRSQPHYDRSAGQWQVDDGQAPAQHTAAPVALRESGDHTDTQRGWQVRPEHESHLSASLPQPSPHYLPGGPRGWRFQSPARRDIPGPQRRALRR